MFAINKNRLPINGVAYFCVLCLRYCRYTVFVVELTGFVFSPPRRVYKRRYKKWYKKLWCYTKIVVRRIAIITLNHPLCEKIVLLLSIYAFRCYIFLFFISNTRSPKANFITSAFTSSSSISICNVTLLFVGEPESFFI